MLSISFLSERRSIDASGRERKRLILRSSATKASRYALEICSEFPFTPAGSGTPQWAVNGCPGHTGHTSLAALSQTVKTKSSFGASVLENSSQLLLLASFTGTRDASSCFSASGRTVPVG